MKLKFTKVHINAVCISTMLLVVIMTALVVEALTEAIGCALGEIILVSVGGMVFALKAFSADDDTGFENGEPPTNSPAA